MTPYPQNQTAAAGSFERTRVSALVFGIEVSGLPLMLPSIAGSPLSRLGWRAIRGNVSGDPGGWTRFTDDQVVVGWSGYAEYRVSAGMRAAIATVDDVDEMEAAMAFLVSVLPLALPLFGIEPFHGSAVWMEGSGLVMLGDTGAGKSTLAAFLDDAGFAVVADDCCAIDELGQLRPGPPFLNSRHDDLAQPVIGEYNRKRVRSPKNLVDRPVLPSAVLLLEPDGTAPPVIAPVAPRVAFGAILANARAGWFLREERRAAQLRAATRLAAVPVASLRFDPDSGDARDTAGMVSHWFRRVVGER